MDKIKTVKIKNPDGSVSEETYTISVDAKDVDMKNGKDLQDTIGDINVDRDGSIAEQLGKYKDYDSDIETLYADVDSLEAKDTDLENDIIDLQVNKINKTDIIDNLNSSSNTKVLSANQGKVLGDAVTALEAENVKKKAYFFDTVADMKAVTYLKNGDMVITSGYYKINDGFGSIYSIRDRVESDVETESLIFLQNSLVAIKIKNFGGTMARHPFGNYTNACVENVNNTGIRAQILGISNLGQSNSRDHMIRYAEFRTQTPNSYQISSVDETSVTLETTPTNVFIGSIIDLYSDNTYIKNQKYSGFVTDINDNIIYVSGWYYSGNQSEGQLPENVAIACIDMPNKVWVENENLLLESTSNVEEGVIAEYGLFNNKYDETNFPNAVANGIDIVNFTGYTNFAIYIRSVNDDIEKPFRAGIRIEDCNNGINLKDCNNYFLLYDGNNIIGRFTKNNGLLFYTENLSDAESIIKTNNSNLLIDKDGLVKNISYRIKSISSSQTIDLSTACIFLLTTSSNTIFTIPTSNLGRNIKLRSSANSDNTLNMNGRSYTLPAKKTADLIFDGANWIDLNNNIVSI